MVFGFMGVFHCYPPPLIGFLARGIVSPGWAPCMFWECDIYVYEIFTGTFGSAIYVFMRSFLVPLGQPKCPSRLSLPDSWASAACNLHALGFPMSGGFEGRGELGDGGTLGVGCMGGCRGCGSCSDAWLRQGSTSSA